MWKSSLSRHTPILICAIILASCVMRSPITGTGPISDVIAHELGLSSTGAGLLTAIPLFVFAVVSIPIANIAQRTGTIRTLTAGIACILAGILVRSYAGTFGLYVGMTFIGIGIACANVLIPVAVKTWFPLQIGKLTALYTTAMSVASSIAGGIAIGVCSLWGWQASLALWAIPGAVALVFWISLTRIPHPKVQVSPHGVVERINENEGGGKAYRADRDSGNSSLDSACEQAIQEASSTTNRPDAHAKSHTHRGSLTSMATNPTAWAMGVYFGLQSVLFYTSVAWLTHILQAKGFDANTASMLNFVYIIIGIIGSIVAPTLAARHSSQSKGALALGVVYAASMCVLALSNIPIVIIYAVVGCGLLQGASFSLILALFGLKAKTPEIATSLSGFAQATGYVIAAFGPTAAGALFDSTGSWGALYGVLIGVTVLLAITGYYIGKDRLIE